MKKKMTLALAACVLVLSACGVPQGDYDALLAERDALAARLAQLEEQQQPVRTTVGGTFSATVRGLMPDYGLDDTTPRVAVVTLFQLPPFTLPVGELAQELTVGETYVFTVTSPGDVEVDPARYQAGSLPVEEAVACYNLRAVAARPAQEGERGMVPYTLTFDFVYQPEEPAPQPDPATPPEKTGEAAPVPADQLPGEVQSDLAWFREQEEKANPTGLEYRYLYLTGPDGEPVANVTCFTEGNWTEYLAEGGSKINGLSRNSGLVPFYLYEDSPADLYLVNTQTDGYPFTHQKVALTQPVLESLGKGEVLPVTWEGQTPREMEESGIQMVSVTVRDQDGTPLPDKLVVFREAMAYTPGDGIPDAAFREPAVTPAARRADGVIPTMGQSGSNEQRYTDQNGVARFPVERVFGKEPEGRWNLSVQSSFSNPYTEKTVTVEVGTDGPWEFEVALNTGDEAQM